MSWRKQFLRNLISNIKSRLLRLHIQKKCEKMIELLCYLEVGDWLQGINYIYGSSAIGESQNCWFKCLLTVVQMV